MMLISYAERFKGVPGEIAQRPYPVDHRVPFCESEAYVWLIPNGKGTVSLSIAVENPSGISAKALAAILTETLSGSTPDVISSISPEIVTGIFRENISMGKGMGLTGLVEMIRLKARELSHGQALQEEPNSGGALSHDPPHRA